MKVRDTPKLPGKNTGLVKLCKYSLFHIKTNHEEFLFHIKTNYEEFSNLKRIEKKIETCSTKPIIGFD